MKQIDSQLKQGTISFKEEGIVNNLPYLSRWKTRFEIYKMSFGIFVVVNQKQMKLLNTKNLSRFALMTPCLISPISDKQQSSLQVKKKTL